MSDTILYIDELIDVLKKYNHRELHIHHTWKPTHKNWDTRPDPFYWQNSMRSYHVNNRKWQDIGQHVTLLPDGRFVTGRDFNKDPASIKGYNDGAFCVEMLGNFDLPGTGVYNNQGYDELKGAQKEAIVKLAHFFYEQGKYIRFHRENANKTCPGTSLDKNVFMSWVRGQETPTQKEVTPMVNKYIEETQKALKEQGINPGPIDGIMGPKTLAAIEQALERLRAAEERIRKIKEIMGG